MQMQRYAIMSRFNGSGALDPASFKQTAERVASRIKQECPDVHWQDSYMLMGSVDVLDLVDSDNPRAVEKAAMIIRSESGARTETSLATPWKDLLTSL